MTMAAASGTNSSQHVDVGRAVDGRWAMTGVAFGLKSPDALIDLTVSSSAATDPPPGRA
jgi:hypothetical protein